MALRGAIVGFGNVAEKGHVPGWRACRDVEIVAATDAVADRAEALAATLPEARFYADADALFAAEDLDFIDLCTPPGRHAELIDRALAAGLPLLCENPPVTQAADLATRAADARGRNLVLHTVHNWLKAPICRQITALVDACAIGPVRGVRWETLRIKPAVTVEAGATGNWRADPALAGGGILFDHGWHALYCVARWAGGMPQTVAASLERRKYTDWPLEDTASVTVTFGQAAASVFLTWTADERANKIEIEGADGTLSVAHDRVIVETGDGRREWPCPPALSEGSHHPDWFQEVAEDFLAAVAGAGAGADGNLGEALMCAQLIDRAQASSAAGGGRLAFGSDTPA